MIRNGNDIELSHMETCITTRQINRHAIFFKSPIKIIFLLQSLVRTQSSMVIRFAYLNVNHCHIGIIWDVYIQYIKRQITFSLIQQNSINQHEHEHGNELLIFNIHNPKKIICL